MVALNYGSIAIETGVSRDHAQAWILSIFRTALECIKEGVDLNLGFARIELRPGVISTWFDDSFTAEVQEYENSDKVRTRGIIYLFYTLLFFGACCRVRR
jgi:hypothetical protein